MVFRLNFKIHSCIFYVLFTMKLGATLQFRNDISGSVADTHVYWKRSSEKKDSDTGKLSGKRK